MRHDYRPNWSDPRIQARADKVVNWCLVNLSDNLDLPVSANVINDVFGPLGNQFSDYLRSNLLVRTDMYKPGQKFYKYRLKKGGLDRVLANKHQQLFVDTSIPDPLLQRLVSIYQDQLDSKEFVYTLKSDRYWHPLQNISSNKKPEFWANCLPFSYDINTCGPALFVQTAMKAGLSEIIAGPIQDYLNDKNALRTHVCNLTGLPLRDAKKLINSLFNGARLTKSSFCATYNLIRAHYSASETVAKLDNLQNDPQIRLLRIAIRTGWNKIARALKYDTSTSKNKWALYFKLERLVLDAIRDELIRQDVKFFTEHDGFRTDRPVQVDLVQKAIQQKTGFTLNISTAAIC